MDDIHPFAEMTADIAAFLGLESRFHDGPQDPWADRLMVKFVHFCLYGDKLSFIVPVPDAAADPSRIEVPWLLNLMQRHSQFGLRAKGFDKSQQRTAGDEWFYEHFGLWVEAISAAPDRLKHLHQWSDLHASSWLSADHKSRVPEMTVFRLGELHRENVELIDAASERFQLDVPRLLYAFDSVSRFPFYNDLRGEGIYLSHPLRSTFRAPSMTRAAAGEPSRYPLSFKSWALGEAKQLSAEAFVKKLANMRVIAQDLGLSHMEREELDPPFITELCSKMGIAPATKPEFEKGVERGVKLVSAPAGAIVGGVVGSALDQSHNLLGGLVGLGVGALLGEVVGVVATSWTNRLAGMVSKSSSLSLATHYPAFEAQIEDDD